MGQSPCHTGSAPGDAKKASRSYAWSASVTTHVRNLFLKLGVNNRIDALNAVRRARPQAEVGL